MGVLTRRKDLADGTVFNRLRRSTDNGTWLIAIPHHINGKEFLRGEFQDNLLLWYGIVSLNLPTDCDGCGKFFWCHMLYCSPRGTLFWHRTTTLLSNGAPF